MLTDNKQTVGDKYLLEDEGISGPKGFSVCTSQGCTDKDATYMSSKPPVIFVTEKLHVGTTKEHLGFTDLLHQMLILGQPENYSMVSGPSS